MKINNKTITPTSGVHEIGANTSALKMFFRCNETAEPFIDTIRGSKVYFSDGGFTLSRDSTLNAMSTDMLVGSTAVQVRAADPALHTFLSGSAIMVIMSCRIVDGTQMRFSINGNGGGSLNHIGMASQAWHSVVSDGSGNFSDVYISAHTGLAIDATLNGHDVMVVLHYLSGTGITRYEMYNLSTGILETIGGVDISATGATLSELGTNPTTVGNVAPTGLRFSGIKVYGVGYYEFSSNTIPTDWKSGSLWNAASWKNGNRYSYPPWRGRT